MYLQKRSLSTAVGFLESAARNISSTFSAVLAPLIWLSTPPPVIRPWIWLLLRTSSACLMLPGSGDTSHHWTSAGNSGSTMLIAWETLLAGRPDVATWIE